MASSGRILLATIRESLDACLPGCVWKAKKHNWHIYPPGGGSPGYLPLGEHGNRKRVEIEIGHVRKLCRQFNVTECMQGRIVALSC